MQAPNPSDLKEEKCDWKEQCRRYPTQPSYGKESKCCIPKDGLMLKLGQCINDIPVEERHRYMWIVPDELKNHPQYKEKDWGARIIRECEDKKCCEENEKKKREKDKEDKIDQQERTIQALVDHLAKLTEAVNKLTKGAKPAAP